MRILMLSLLLLFSLIGEAQLMPVVSTTVKIPQALCIQCKNRLEYQVRRLNGVQEFVVNYRKGEARLKFLTDRTDIEQVKTMIANTGYDADDILANPDAYNRLPVTCKKKIKK
ncbi:MAG: heavy-metal-associated domain-containing protein [Bacteroidetes bacterium]|nr:heavy-metal-associated domain-containing protein [Bacteroidota bacterium]